MLTPSERESASFLTTLRGRTARARLVLFVASSLCCLAAGMTGCDDADDAVEPTAAASTAATSSEGADSTDKDDLASGEDAGSGELVTVTEPTEGAFTVSMPKGWENRTQLVRIQGQDRALCTAVKPGGDTFVFLGDPKIPVYNVPTAALNANSPLAKFNQQMKFSPYASAPQFFTAYVKKKFGKIPGFRVTGTAPNPRMEKVGREQAAKNGLDARISAATVSFEYANGGKTVHALVNGMTLAIGTVWVADVNGFSTTGNPAAYKDLVMRMAESYRTDPEWQATRRARSQQEHERTMAQIQANTDAMTRQHERNMAAIQSSARRHQARMDAIHTAGDAQMNNWKAQQEQSDVSHERFLNSVKGEETVVTPNGGSHQVQTGSGRYFVNKNDGTYVGTDSKKEREDLRKVWGLNPDDYEETKIKP